MSSDRRMTEATVCAVMREGWDQRRISKCSKMKRACGPCALTSCSLRSSLMAALGIHLGLAATCCFNSTSGQPFDSCTCLADNSQITGQVVGRGESALYHWVLEGSNVELITSSERGNLTFKISPCSGSARMDIKTSNPASWPDMPTFTSEDDWNPTALTISVQASEYTVFVTAGDQTNSSTFDIATYNTLLEIPNPGGDGILTAAMPTTTTAAITFNTSHQQDLTLNPIESFSIYGKHWEKTPSLGNVSYRLYWTSASTTWTEGQGEEIPPACVIPSDGLSLVDNPNCLFSSVCGMDLVAEGMSDWMTLSSDTEHSFEAPVLNGVQYMFNVAMRDANNITSTYRASNMTFSFTTYEQCVSDPGCESQVHTDSTIIAVCCLAVTVLMLLVGCTTAMRFSMRSTMEGASGKVARNAKAMRLAYGGLSDTRPQPATRATVANKYHERKTSGTSLEEDDYPDELGFSKAKIYSSAPLRSRGLGFDGSQNVGDGRGLQDEDEPSWTDSEENDPLPRRNRTSTRLMKSPPVSPEISSRSRRRGGGTAANSDRGGGGGRDGGGEDGKSGRDSEEDRPSPRRRRTSSRQMDGPSPRSRRTSSRRMEGREKSTRDTDEESERDPEGGGPPPRSRGKSTRQRPKSPETLSPLRRDGVRDSGGSAARNRSRGQEDGEANRRGGEETDTWPRSRGGASIRRTKSPSSPEAPSRRFGGVVWDGGVESRRRSPSRSGAAGDGRYRGASGSQTGNFDFDFDGSVGEPEGELEEDRDVAAASAARPRRNKRMGVRTLDDITGHKTKASSPAQRSARRRRRGESPR